MGNKKMKIMIIAASNLPIPAFRGGATETIVSDLLNNHIISNNETILIDVFSNCSGTIIKKKNMNFYFYEKTTFDRIEFFFYWFIRQISLRKLPIPNNFPRAINKIVDLNSYDIIILEGNKDQVKSLRFYYQGIIILHIHTVMTLSENVYGAKKIYEMCDYLIGNSEYTSKILKRLGNRYNSNKVITLKNCIDLESLMKSDKLYRREFRKKNNIPYEKKVFVYCGRLEAGKGVLELIQAFKKSCIDSKLIIIGSNWFCQNKKTQYIKKLEQESEDIKDRIIFTGFINHNEIGKYYRVADIAIMPSLYEEAAGLVALEAQACGLPIIISNIGGIPEFVSNKSNLIIDVDHKFVEKLSNKIKQIYYDDTLYYNEKKISNEFIKNYNMDDYANRFLNIINKIKTNNI